MIRGPVGRKNLRSSCIMESERKFSRNFGASSRKCHILKIERGTLKKGAESSSFPRKSNMFEIHLVKQNKPNGHMSDTLEGECKAYGRRIRLADQT